MTPSAADQTDMALAHRLADAAGAAIRPWFRSGTRGAAKADTTPVSEADTAAEGAIRQILAQAAPDDAVLGEEYGLAGPTAPAEAERLWVLDPVDGTRAFLQGKPTFTTLIALVHQGQPTLGVIDQPVTGERWIGHVTGGAWYRGLVPGPARPRTRACSGLAGAQLATTSPLEFTAAQWPHFDALASRVARLDYGGDSYNYACLALGGGDLVAEANLKPYDYAALVPVVAGAGGVITDWTGAALTIDGELRTVLAAGDAACHRAALAALAGSG